MPTQPTNASSSPPRSPDAAAADTQSAKQPTLPPAAADPAATTPLTLEPGAQPVPDFELVRRLGEGGFGEVWQARGPGGFDCALKFIKLDKKGSQLEQGALETMKSIRHPNLVGLFGVWQRDNLLILAMELCDGSLQDRLDEVLEKKQTGLPVNELLKYVRDAASGLDALHAKGVQHRDVKPLNLLRMQGGVKVADFGLAKVLDHTAASHTGAMSVPYAAPEFFKGTTTQQSDQYSLAATYVHLRTGHLLFGGSYHQVVYGHMSVPPDLTELGEAEGAVVARALDKEPEKRWRTCTTFVNELIKAHKAAPSKPPQPSQKEAPPQPKRAAKPTGSKADLLAQPTILPPPPVSRRDNAPTELRQSRTKDKNSRQPARGSGWLGPVLVGLFLLVLVSCGAFGALGVGMGLFSGTPTTQPPGNSANKTDKTDIAYQPPLGKSETKLPSSMVVDLGGGVKMEFVLIDPRNKPDGGRFKMGSPEGEKDRSADEKQHDVELTKSYYLAKYPVTQEQYQQVMGKNPSNFKDDSGRLPVEEVSWDDTQDFCREMMKKYSEQIPTALRQPQYRFALPTEAQWEYACRAGTQTPFYFGSKLNGKEANCDGNYPYGTDEKGPYKQRTTKVGEYGENPWGLCDMHGNVYQWCQDYYGPYNEDLNSTDPLRTVKYSEERRVLRGGSWGSSAGYCRAACRNNFVAPGGRHHFVGFRVCVRLD